jgi:MFS family permease
MSPSISEQLSSTQGQAAETPSSSSSSDDALTTSPTYQDKDAYTGPNAEESLEARIERLGRERPSTFKSTYTEVAFVFSILMSQILTEYFVSGFTLLIPTLITDLNIPQSASVWPATAFSIVIASTLLVWGRIGDMVGGYPVYLFGLAWLLVWSIIAGFSVNPLMLDFCRAFQGLGAAAFLPTGVMLMGSIYRPGPRKNLVFALYGTCAVIGFFIGILLAGVVGQYLRWGWYFWIGAFFTAITLALSIFSIPNDHSERAHNGIQMDYLGAALTISSLILIIFSITESAHAPHGWTTPYIPSLFVLGILLLLASIYTEARIATQPLLPAQIFAIRGMLPLTLALMLLYGTLGIFLLYGTQYFQNIMSATPLQIVAWYTPLFVGGLVLSTAEGLILHLVPGRILLIISGVGATLAQLLLALIPDGGSYWAWLLPATLCGTIGIDLSYNLMTVFVTTVLPKKHQGLGGGLINVVLQLGIALCLGFTDIIQTYTVQRSATPDSIDTLRTSYKNTFWFGVAAASCSLLLMAVWGDIPKAKSELTADEKEDLQTQATRELELEREATRESQLARQKSARE